MFKGRPSLRIFETGLTIKVSARLRRDYAPEFPKKSLCRKKMFIQARYLPVLL